MLDMLADPVSRFVLAHRITGLLNGSYEDLQKLVQATKEHPRPTASGSPACCTRSSRTWTRGGASPPCSPGSAAS